MNYKESLILRNEGITLSIDLVSSSFKLYSKDYS